MIWNDDLFSSLLIFTIIETILSTFFFTVSKFYKNLVKSALTEIESNVAGTTTLDRECMSHLYALLGFPLSFSFLLQKWGPCRSKVWHMKNIIISNKIYFVYPILWSNCNFLCFLCFVCLYLYVFDPHGCIIMQIKNYYYY